MAQDRHPDVALVIAHYGTQASVPAVKENDSTKTLDAIATAMGVGWDRNRAQQAIRELHKF